jgi:serine/threonine protein kinase
MEHEDWTTTGALGDRYVLRTRVGSGRTTTVYVADDVRLERQVAVKLLHPLPDDEGFARFANEARVLGGLSHPGLVTVYDVNLQADRPYMVMRLVDGEPLSTHVDDDDFEPAAIAQLGAQLADVLAYVHERGVVHGDLDASNILIDGEDTGHLTGFGAERGLGRPSGDIHALGMTLAEYLPFDLGPEWRMVLSVMTDPDPDARPDAMRCGELLRNIASGVTNEFPLPDLSAEPEPEEEPAEAKRKRPAYTGLAGIGLAATALAVAVATTVNTGTTGDPSGERQNPPAEQQEQPGDTEANPPAQTYPGGKAPQPARQQPSKPTKPPSSTTTPPRSTATPPDDGDGDDGNDGPGNGNGNGNGNDDDRGRGGLIGIIIGGLG